MAITMLMKSVVVPCNQKISTRRSSRTSVAIRAQKNDAMPVNLPGRREAVVVGLSALGALFLKPENAQAAFGANRQAELVKGRIQREQELREKVAKLKEQAKLANPPPPPPQSQTF